MRGNVKNKGSFNCTLYIHERKIRQHLHLTLFASIMQMIRKPLLQMAPNRYQPVGISVDNNKLHTIHCSIYITKRC